MASPEAGTGVTERRRRVARPKVKAAAVVGLEPLAPLPDVAAWGAAEAADREVQYARLTDAEGVGSMGAIVGNVVRATFQRYMSGTLYGLDDVVGESLAPRQQTMLAQAVRLLALMMVSTNTVDILVPSTLQRVPGFNEGDTRARLTELLRVAESRRDLLLKWVTPERLVAMAAPDYDYAAVFRDRAVCRCLAYYVLSVLWHVLWLWPEAHRPAALAALARTPALLCELPEGDPRRLIGERYRAMTHRFAGFLRSNMGHLAAGLPDDVRADDARLTLTLMHRMLPLPALATLGSLGRAVYVPAHADVLRRCTGVRDLLPLFKTLLEGNAASAPLAAPLVGLLEGGGGGDDGSDSGSAGGGAAVGAGGAGAAAAEDDLAGCAWRATVGPAVTVEGEGEGEGAEAEKVTTPYRDLYGAAHWSKPRHPLACVVQ